MRLPLLCFLFLFLCTCTSTMLGINKSGGLRAQNNEDFAPFRPGTIYNYTNPFAADVPDNPSVSPVLGFHWPTYLEFDSEVVVNKVAIPSSSPGSVRIISHFVGDLLEEGDGSGWTMYFYGRTEPPFFFRLIFEAAEGENFMVNATVEATVDSVVSTSFFGVTDDVKYISLRDSTTGTRYPDIQLSRNYGMLYGPYFSNLNATSVPLRLLSLNSELSWVDEAEQLGTDYLDPMELSFAVSDAYQEETSAEILNGVAGIRVTHRHWMTGNPGCDPIFDGSFTPYRVREVNYFLPGNGGEPYDSTVVPSYHDWQGIYYTPYVDDEWRTLPLGSVYTDEGGVSRVKLPIDDDCMGEGFRLGDRLTVGFNPDEMLIEPASSGTTYYRHSFVPAFEPATTEHGQRRLVGISSGDMVCGTTFDFEPLYVSTDDFPDDPLITLAPNPATDRVMFAVPFEHGPVSLAVYDAAGRKLRTTAMTGGDRWLDVQDLSSGVYTIVLANQEGPVARRRLVKR